ncbi:ATP-binding protein [Streptomyces bambusae]|uniref:ATP-binding protein n=1 Tax=Streptomyces bambusae TaxID=1550616 RepID=UPI001CFEFC4E|nr:ATP-binding protein [Streptomyces bambusae]MCB5168509.1 ATP-binding protein [Streptomyces bambusae]
MSATPRSARLARLFAVEEIRSWGLPQTAGEHVIAELTANAVTHGRVPGRDFHLAVSVHGATLRIEVSDPRGTDLPALREPTATSGRGLAIVNALSTRWGVTPGPAPRKTVWAELALPPGAHDGGD